MSKQVLSVEQFEVHLRRFLDEKSRRQPSFSIRNQASRWRVNHSTLQRIANGKRRLGIHMAKELAQHFNVEIAKDKRDVRVPKRWRLNTLDPESPVQMSWLNLALLELMKLTEFEPSFEWIADRLGQPTQVVAQAIEQMEAEGMLSISQAGWTDLSGDAVVIKSTLLMRKVLNELIDVSKLRLNDTRFQDRENHFAIMPILRSDLPELKKKIQRFSADLYRLSQKARSLDEVYALKIGFFPLTQIKEHAP